MFVGHSVICPPAAGTIPGPCGSPPPSAVPISVAFRSPAHPARTMTLARHESSTNCLRRASSPSQPTTAIRPTPLATSATKPPLLSDGSYPMQQSHAARCQGSEILLDEHSEPPGRSPRVGPSAGSGRATPRRPLTVRHGLRVRLRSSLGFRKGRNPAAPRRVGDAQAPLKHTRRARRPQRQKQQSPGDRSRSLELGRRLSGRVPIPSDQTTSSSLGRLVRERRYRRSRFVANHSAGVVESDHRFAVSRVPTAASVIAVLSRSVEPDLASSVS